MDSVQSLLIQGMTQERRLPKTVQILLTPHHTLLQFLSTHVTIYETFTNETHSGIVLGKEAEAV
jgi:hypothetical protein